MKRSHASSSGPDSTGIGVSRRAFLQSGSGLGLTVIGGGLGLGLPNLARAATTAKGASDGKAETLVKSLFASLNEEQREKVVLPFDHGLRRQVNNNWHILEQERVGKTFNADQQAMIREIFLELHSDEYRDRVRGQFVSDNRRGKERSEEAAFGSASVALFGDPGDDGEGKFEFVFTGRHTTRRCDGNSVDGLAFGGPIFYGHAARSFNEDPKHEGNAYWFQAIKANEAFQALDGKQREIALRTDAKREQGTRTVALKGTAEGLTGLPVGDLSADQKAKVQETLETLVAPFRKVDQDECRKYLKDQFEALHLTFYSNRDLGNDGVWDVWQIEGPDMLWYFRGAPHVHTWVNIRRSGDDPFSA